MVCTDAEGMEPQLRQGERYEVLAVDFGHPALLTIASGPYALRRFRKMEVV